MYLYSRMSTPSLKASSKNIFIQHHTYTYDLNTRENLNPGRKISIYIFKPWKNRSTCKICKATDHGKRFHDYFITTQICLFCGSLEHKLIDSRMDPHNTNLITTQYSCPYLPYEEWPTLTEQLNNGYLKVQSCPRTFALAHGYQKSDVDRTIIQLATSDYGTSMGKRGLYEFYLEVLRLCDKERRSFNFKRTIITTNESLEEIEFPINSFEL